MVLSCMTSISSEPLGHLIDDDEDDVEGKLLTIEKNITGYYHLS